MLKDIIFVLLVISGAAYAHSYKSTILHFMQSEVEQGNSEVLLEEIDEKVQAL
jgi:hypothetical protein